MFIIKQIVIIIQITIIIQIIIKQTDIIVLVIKKMVTKIKNLH